MEYNNFFKWVETVYRIDITKNLQNTIKEHFGDDLNIYTDQDLYEQSRKIIQDYKSQYYYRRKYWFDE